MKMALESICCLIYFRYIKHKPIVDIQTTKIYFTINFVYPSEIDFTQDAFLQYISTIFKLLVNVNVLDVNLYCYLFVLNVAILNL